MVAAQNYLKCKAIAMFKWDSRDSLNERTCYPVDRPHFRDQLWPAVAGSLPDHGGCPGPWPTALRNATRMSGSQFKKRGGLL